MSNYLVRVSLLFFLLFAVVTLCYLLGGLDGSLLLVKQLLLRSARFVLFRLVGWEVPIILILGVLSGLNDYTCHMQDPAGGQPAANPAAEQGASTSGEDLFTYTSDMLEDMASSGRSSSTSAVNQPLPGEQAIPPAYPVGEQAGPAVPPDPSEIIGGDSIDSIKSRLLQAKNNPSAEEIKIAEYNAEDLFQVKAEIIRGMTPLDPEGDWPGRGARALDNPRTSTGEDSLGNLFRLRDGLLRGDAEIITSLKDRMIFRRAANDASSQN